MKVLVTGGTGHGGLNIVDLVRSPTDVDVDGMKALLAAPEREAVCAAA